MQRFEQILHECLYNGTIDNHEYIALWGAINDSIENVKHMVGCAAQFTSDYGTIGYENLLALAYKVESAKMAGAPQNETK